MYKALRYLKVGGRYIDTGEVVKLGELKGEEVDGLVKEGTIVEVDKTVAPSSTIKKEGPEAVGNEFEEDLTDEEVKVELLEKISHTIAVKELKLLGAEFKANASLENLVELIMENEDYEDHFLDYIEQNEL